MCGMARCKQLPIDAVLKRAVNRDRSSVRLRKVCVAQDFCLGSESDRERLSWSDGPALTAAWRGSRQWNKRRTHLSRCLVLLLRAHVEPVDGRVVQLNAATTVRMRDRARSCSPS